MINLRKVVNTIYIGIRDIHPRYIKLLYFYISYIEFHIFVYPPIIGKRIPVLPPPVFVFIFHPRMSHIFFLIFRKPRALSTDETRPWKRDRTRNKGVPRKNCDFQAERRRLVSPRKRTVLFRNRRSNPLVAGISESDARDNGRGKKRRHRPVVGEKASGKRELYLFHSVSTRASIQRMADFYIDFFFSFPSFEGKKGLMEEACEKVLEMD